MFDWPAAMKLVRAKKRKNAFRLTDELLFLCKKRSLGSPTAPCFLMRYRGVTLLLDTGMEQTGRDCSGLLDMTLSPN